MFGKLPDDLLHYRDNVSFQIIPAAGEIFVPVNICVFGKMAPAPPLPGADLAV